MSNATTWYLNDGQRQYGPYSTDAVTSMIASRPMGNTYIGAAGEEGWVPLSQHPIFAASVAGYASAHVVAPRAEAHGKGSAPTKALLAGAVAFVALVCTAAVLASGWTSRMVQLAPDDVQLYVEATDLSEMRAALEDVGWVDEDRLDTDRAKEEIADVLEASFDIEDRVAEGVVEGLRGVALAVRKDADSSETQWALMLDFAASEHMEELFASRRFDDDGELGDHVRAYEVEAGRHRSGASSSTLESAFSSISLGYSSGDTMLAWFQDDGIMVLGSHDLIDDMADVAEDRQPSLIESEQWAEVPIEDDAQGLVFVSPSLFDDRVRGEIELDLDLEELGPMTLSTRFDELGSISTVHGSARLRRGRPQDSVELELSERLPRGTLAYVSYHPSVGSIDEQVADLVVEAFPQASPGFIALDLKPIVMDLQEVMDGERLVALVGSQDLRLGVESSLADIVPHMAVAVVTRVDRDELAAWMKGSIGQMVSSVRDQRLPTGHRISVEEGSVWIRAASSDAPSARAILLDDDVAVIAIGSERMIDEIVHTVRGDGSGLGDVAEHQAFVEMRTADEGARAWADVRQMARVMPDITNPLSDVEWIRELGISPRVMTIDGAEPMTMGLSLSVTSEDRRGRLELRALNVVASPCVYYVAQFGSRLVEAASRGEILGGGAGMPTGSNSFF